MSSRICTNVVYGLDWLRVSRQSLSMATGSNKKASRFLPWPPRYLPTHQLKSRNIFAACTKSLFPALTFSVFNQLANKHQTVASSLQPALLPTHSHLNLLSKLVAVRSPLFIECHFHASSSKLQTDSPSIELVWLLTMNTKKFLTMLNYPGFTWDLFYSITLTTKGFLISNCLRKSSKPNDWYRPRIVSPSTR